MSETMMGVVKTMVYIIPVLIMLICAHSLGRTEGRIEVMDTLQDALRDDVTDMVPKDCDLDLDAEQEKFGNMIRMVVAIHVLERIRREY